MIKVSKKGIKTSTNTCVKKKHFKSIFLSTFNAFIFIFNTWVNSFGMSFSSLSMVLGGNGVVNPANLVEMSSADVEEGEEMSEDLLLLRLPPVEFPSKIIFNGGGWVRK